MDKRPNLLQRGVSMATDFWADCAASSNRMWTRHSCKIIFALSGAICSASWWFYNDVDNSLEVMGERQEAMADDVRKIETSIAIIEDRVMNSPRQIVNQ